MEKGLEVFYCYCIPRGCGVSSWGTSVIGKEARVPLGVSAIGLQIGGRKVSKVQVDDQSLKAKEYLGLRCWKVRRVTLSTDRGLVGLSAVQVEVWFSVDQDSFVDPQRYRHLQRQRHQQRQRQRRRGSLRLYRSTVW